MSAQELADLESLYADGVLDEDEYKTKLAELQPAKERTRADELADLEALRNDGILDDDEYKAKLAELQDDEPPVKKAKTEDEDYEALTVSKLKAKSKERGLAATGEKGMDSRVSRDRTSASGRSCGAGDDERPGAPPEEDRARERRELGFAATIKPLRIVGSREPERDDGPSPASSLR